MTINLNFRNPPQLFKFSKRETMDIIAWSVFFILSIIFSALYFIHEYDQTGMTQTEIVSVIIKSSIYYTIFMMLPVYLNLNVLKKYLLDTRIFGLWTYLPYTFGVLLIALAFAWLFKFAGIEFSNFLQADLPWWLNGLIIFAVQLIASGLMYKRELLIFQKSLPSRKRTWRKLKWLTKVLDEKLDEVEEMIKTTRVSEHIFVQNTSKTRIRSFPENEVLFVEPHANGTMIYFSEHGGLNRVANSDTLSKCLESVDFGNANLVQIHRGLLINTNRVVGRNGNKILLDAVVKIRTMESKIGDLEINSNMEIPIGDKFLDKIDLEKWLKIKNKIRKNLADESNGENNLN